MYNIVSGRSFCLQAHTTHVMPAEPLAMLSTRWVHTLISCSACLISILLLINPGYFSIVVAPARRCPGPFFIFCRNPQLDSRNVRDMYWTCLRKDYPLVIRFVLPCPILCPDMCPHIYGTTAVCLSVCHAALSILSKGVYKHPSVKRIATGCLYIN